MQLPLDVWPFVRVAAIAIVVTLLGVSLNAQAVAPPGSFAFRDDPLVPGVSVLRAAHIDDLRSAIADLRAQHGIALFIWNRTTLAGSVVRALDVAELRTALDAVYDRVQQPRPTYVIDPTLTAGMVIKAAHIRELRAAINAAPRGGVLALLRTFSHPSERGAVRVYSTISQSFSDTHAAHADLTWNYFKTVFAKSIGSRTEMYYTEDVPLYLAILAYCPTVFIPGARNVTVCWDAREGMYRWVIIPYVIPDFGTQLHELSHSFLFATWPPAETNVWFKEGTGMYYESGSFVGPDLIVNSPHAYLTTNFRRWSNAGGLLPLADLLRLPRDSFYSRDATLVYSQAGMFVYYLMKQHPATMATVFGGLNHGTVRNNDDLIGLITSGTGMTLAALDQAYRTYALQF